MYVLLQDDKTGQRNRGQSEESGLVVRFYIRGELKAHLEKFFGRSKANPNPAQSWVWKSQGRDQSFQLGNGLRDELRNAVMRSRTNARRRYSEVIENIVAAPRAAGEVSK
jgi:hypothetical protein